jgi:uncharacterized protein (TIGR03067 family)
MTGILAVLVACSPAPVDGTWEVVSFEAKGVVLEKHPYRGGTMQFGEGELTIRGKDGVEELSYTLDRTATPTAIDITGGREKRYPLKGIVRRDGDTLRVCVVLPPYPLGRPAEFKTSPRNKSELWTLKRVAPTAREPRVIAAGKQPAHVALAPDGKALAVGCGEALKQYDPATGKEVRSLGGNTRPVRAVAFSPDGKLLASGTGGFRDGKQGGEVRVWDLAAGKVTLTPAWWENGDVQAVAFSADGKRLAAGGSQGIRVWEVATGKLEKEIKTEAAVLALAFSPDGRVLAAGAFTERVHTWDTESWKETVLGGHMTEVRAVCYSPDGKTLITGAGGEFRVWDRANKLLKAVKHPDMVYAVAFTRDGKAVATVGGLPREDLTGTICLWDTTDWSEKQRWSGKGGLFESLAFSPDGKVLAAGRFDGTVEIRKLP